MCEQEIAGYIVLVVIIGWLYKLFFTKKDKEVIIYRTRKDMFMDNPMTKEERESLNILIKGINSLMRISSLSR